jgi:acetyl esterase/lipase
LNLGSGNRTGGGKLPAVKALWSPYLDTAFGIGDRRKFIQSRGIHRTAKSTAGKERTNPRA